MRAIRILTIDQPIAIIVDAVPAELRLGHAAGRIALAIRIIAIDEPIAIVIDAVAADFGARDADTSRIHRAIGIVAIDEAVAIIIDAVAADLGARDAAAGGMGRAIGIETIDKPIAIVVDAVGAIFAGAGVHARLGIIAIITATSRVDIAISVGIRTEIHAGVQDRIARIDGAGDAIITIGRGGDNAADARIAGILAITEVAVVAARMIGDEDALAGAFVTMIDGAIDAIVADDRIAGDAALVDAALDAVAIEPIIAFGVDGAALADAAEARLTALPLGAERIVGLKDAALFFL